MKLYSQTAQEVLQEALRRAGYANISSADSERVLAYEMKVPYDIRIMAADRHQGEVFRRFFMLDQNLCWTSTGQEGADLFCSISGPFVQSSFLRKRTPPHRHNYFEMMFVLNGAMEQYIEGGRFEDGEGTVCLMNCNTEHCEAFGHDFAAVYFCLSREFLRAQILPLLEPHSQLEAFFQNNTQEQSDFKKDYIRFPPQSERGKEEVEFLLNTITQEKLLDLPGAQPIICGLVLRLFGVLQNPALYALEYNKLDSSAEAYIFYKVTRIMECETRALGRGELAQRLNYNGDYINRVVKKYSGLSLVQYNRTIRLKKAEWLLAESDLPVTQIILRLGYENRTHFYRLFENRYKVTPQEYRQRYGHRARERAERE